jgi:hypothetical protein
MGIELHYVPKDGSTAYLNHRFWFDDSLFTKASTKSTCEDKCFHFPIPIIFKLKKYLVVILSPKIWSLNYTSTLADAAQFYLNNMNLEPRSKVQR